MPRDPKELVSPKEHPVIAILSDPANLASSVMMEQKIKAAGGTPVVIKDFRAFKDEQIRRKGAEEVMRQFDGVVVMGDKTYDIAPETYNQRAMASSPPRHHHTKSEIRGPEKAWKRMNTQRDMIHEALRSGVPLLGIGEGMLRINIEAGEEDRSTTASDMHRGKGTLIQHLPDIIGQEACEQPAQIAVQSESKLAATLNAASGTSEARSITAPALQHQAIGQLGDGLVASAGLTVKNTHTGEDMTLAQAIEADPNGKYGNQFVLGVQFYPEDIKGENIGEALAQKLVSEAAQYAAKQADAELGQGTAKHEAVAARTSQRAR